MVAPSLYSDSYRSLWFYRSGEWTKVTFGSEIPTNTWEVYEVEVSGNQIKATVYDSSENYITDTGWQTFDGLPSGTNTYAFGLHCKPESEVWIDKLEFYGEGGGDTVDIDIYDGEAYEVTGELVPADPPEFGSYVTGYLTVYSGDVCLKDAVGTVGLVHYESGTSLKDSTRGGWATVSYSTPGYKHTGILYAEITIDYSDYVYSNSYSFYYEATPDGIYVISEGWAQTYYDLIEFEATLAE